MQNIKPLLFAQSVMVVLVVVVGLRIISHVFVQTFVPTNVNHEEFILLEKFSWARNFKSPITFGAKQNDLLRMMWLCWLIIIKDIIVATYMLYSWNWQWVDSRNFISRVSYRVQSMNSIHIAYKKLSTQSKLCFIGKPENMIYFFPKCPKIAGSVISYETGGWQTDSLIFGG